MIFRITADMVGSGRDVEHHVGREFPADTNQGAQDRFLEDSKRISSLHPTANVKRIALERQKTDGTWVEVDHLSW